MLVNFRLFGLIVIIVTVLAAFVLISAPVAAAQQTPAPGSVCVLAFDDSGQHHSRSPGDALLSDINITVMVDQKTVIANHVTDGKEPYCFHNLPPKEYTVSFSSPFYDPTTLSTFTFILAPGEQVNQEFGALAKVTPSPTPANSVNLQLTRTVRLGVSAVGAILAMALLVALGLILFSVFVHR